MANIEELRRKADAAWKQYWEEYNALRPTGDAYIIFLDANHAYYAAVEQRRQRPSRAEE